MLMQPLTYTELACVMAGVLGVLVVVGLATSLLARRKGYDGGLWGFAGATLVGLAVLALLKSADDAKSTGAQARRRLLGNRIAGCLIVAAILIVVSASIGTNPDEHDLRRFIADSLPQARDKRVAQMMAGGGLGLGDLKRESYGVYSTARVFAPAGGRVSVIGFWGAWWAASEDK
jgi:hypothetical protein